MYHVSKDSIKADSKIDGDGDDEPCRPSQDVQSSYIVPIKYKKPVNIKASDLFKSKITKGVQKRFTKTLGSFILNASSKGRTQSLAQGASSKSKNTKSSDLESSRSGNRWASL